MLIGYCRVSTYEQNEASQVNLLKEKGCDKIYIEKASGKNIKDRPKLKELMEFARAGDKIVVIEMSRLGRNLKDLLLIIDYFLDKGAIVEVGELGEIQPNSFTQRLFIQVLGALSEFQRGYIKESQKRGIEAAKEAGVYKKPRITKMQKVDKFKILEMIENGKRVVDIYRELQFSKYFFYQWVKKNKQFLLENVKNNAKILKLLKKGEE